MRPYFSIDPRLWQLYSETEPGSEIMALLRLREGMEPPEQVRCVVRFGDVITCRMNRDVVPEVREHPAVMSLKAPHALVAEPALLDAAQFGLSTERRRPEVAETGNGVVFGCIDWGLDFAHPHLRNANGSTRLLAIWDQYAEGEAPQPYGYGVVHDRAAIDAALTQVDPYAALRLSPAQFDRGRTGTHATHVCDIAAGNGEPSGMAPRADLVFVNLASRNGGFRNLGDSVALLEALDFIDRTAAGRPWVVNLSMGNLGGPHDGSTLVERAMDNLTLSGPGKIIVQSCGNYFDRNMHGSLVLAPAETSYLSWRSQEVDRTRNEIEVWYPGSAKLRARVVAPDGPASDWCAQNEKVDLTQDGRLGARLYHRASDPNNHDHHILLYQFPEGGAGDWVLELHNLGSEQVHVHAWIERDEGQPGFQARFGMQAADPSSTTNTIANGRHTITVGAWDTTASDFAMGRFSSMGPTRDGRDKPDLVAPGVRVLAAKSASDAGGAGEPQLTRKSGTSMASPHVAGTVALMLEAAGSLGIEDVRKVLRSTANAEGIPEEWAARTGAGRLQAEQAVERARGVRSVEESSTQGMEIGMSTSVVDQVSGCHACQCEDCVRVRRALLGEAVESAPSEDAVIASEDDEAAWDTEIVDDAEGVVGTYTLGTTRLNVDIGSTPDHTANSLDAALLWAFRQGLRHSIIKGKPLTGTSFEVYLLSNTLMLANPYENPPFPSVMECTAGDDYCALVLDGGEAVYSPSSLTSSTTRWVWVPKVKEFFAMARVDRDAQRGEWVDKLAGAKLSIAGVKKTDKTWLSGLSMLTLRILLAEFASQAFKVSGVNQPANNFLGAVVNGVTLPLLRTPLTEPECYIPVIAMAEGKMEAINAYDLGAGISIGSIQINLQRSMFLKFLATLNDRDPVLFNSAVGTPLGWAVARNASGEVTLTIASGNVTLTGKQADESRNIGYFQSGTPGNTRFSQIDQNFRKQTAAAVRNLVAWPHAQYALEATIAEFLMPGLNTMHDPANGIAAIDPSAPDRDLFKLKALLLSCFVRFSGYHGGLLKNLRKYTTIADKLSHVEDAIKAVVTKSGHQSILLKRVAQQRTDAETAFNRIARINAGTLGAESVDTTVLESRGFDWGVPPSLDLFGADLRPEDDGEDRCECAACRSEQDDEAYGASFTRAVRAFRCAPTPAMVDDATQWPSAASDGIVDASNALRALGVSAKQLKTFQSEKGLVQLEPLAKYFGETCLVELLRRLRYPAGSLMKPPYAASDKGIRPLGVTSAAQLLAPRALLAIPGHFREMARRAKDEAEAFALENIGWRLIEILRARMAKVGPDWWVPSPLGWVTDFPATLDATYSPELRALIEATPELRGTAVTQADFDARFQLWLGGYAGRQWQMETGRMNDPSTGAPNPGLPFYDVVTPLNIPKAAAATEAARLKALWKKGSADEATFDASMKNAFAGGLDLTYSYPQLNGKASLKSKLRCLKEIQPHVEALMEAIRNLGWNDLLFQYSGGFVFRAVRGTKSTVSNHALGLAFDLNSFENPRVENPPTPWVPGWAAMDPRIVAIFEAYGFRWGRSIHPKSDPMHFEFWVESGDPPVCNDAPPAESWNFEWDGEDDDDSKWTGSDAQVEFREKCLAEHIARSKKAKGAPLPDLTAAELKRVAGTSIDMKADAADAASALLAAANTDLAAAQTAGDADAKVTKSIGGNSGYRGSEHQRKLWRGYFGDYYNATVSGRKKLADGPHSAAAVKYMLETFGIPNRIAAPGYSNHQGGIAIDFQQNRDKGHDVPNSYDNQGPWKKSWFYQWLNANAATHGFQPYAKEAWHWEFKGTPAAKPSAAPSAPAPQPQPAPVMPTPTSAPSSAPPATSSSWYDPAVNAVKDGYHWVAKKLSLEELEAESIEGERQVVLDAIGAGVFDRNDLANMVFFARHPELPQAPLKRSDSRYEQWKEEWSRIMATVVRPAIEEAATDRDLAVAGSLVAERDPQLSGQQGKHFRELVDWAAGETDLNPGFLAAVLLAEWDRSSTYLSKDPVASFLSGTDDFFASRKQLAANVPAFAKVRFDEKSITKDVNEHGREVMTVTFNSGRDAALATAVYLKWAEIKLRRGASANGGDFDSFDAATRFALTRVAMAAGHGGIASDGTLLRFAERDGKVVQVSKGGSTVGVASRLETVLKGGDFLVRNWEGRAYPSTAKATNRNATILAAQAKHLSRWFFRQKV